MSTGNSVTEGRGAPQVAHAAPPPELRKVHAMQAHSLAEEA